MKKSEISSLKDLWKTKFRKLAKQPLRLVESVASLYINDIDKCFDEIQVLSILNNLLERHNRLPNTHVLTKLLQKLCFINSYSLAKELYELCIETNIANIAIHLTIFEEANKKDDQPLAKLAASNVHSISKLSPHSIVFEEPSKVKLTWEQLTEKFKMDSCNWGDIDETETQAIAKSSPKKFKAKSTLLFFNNDVSLTKYLEKKILNTGLSDRALFHARARENYRNRTMPHLNQQNMPFSRAAYRKKV